jgi:hypothetical protein
LDEEFRITLSLLAGERTTQAQYLWKRHTLPGVRKNQRLRRLLLSSISDNTVWLRNPFTRQFQEYHMVPWPSDTYHQMIERITRGIYFEEFGESLLLATPVKATRATDFKRIGFLSRFYTVKTFSVGRAVQFEYAFMKADDSPRDTFWMYIFQGGECAFAVTGSLAERGDPEPTGGAS